MKRDHVNLLAQGYVGERVITPVNSVYEVLNTGQNVRAVGNFAEREDATLDAYAPELFRVAVVVTSWDEQPDRTLVKLLVDMIDAGLPDSCLRGMETTIDLLRSRLRSV